MALDLLGAHGLDGGPSQNPEQVPSDLRAALSLYSSWTHVEKGGRYMITGFVLLMLPDSPLDHTWGVLYESQGNRFVRPAASFQERFRRSPFPGHFVISGGDPK